MAKEKPTPCGEEEDCQRGTYKKRDTVPSCDKGDHKKRSIGNDDRPNGHRKHWKKEGGWGE